ncbi:hypothetical protein QYZ87_05135 [Porphyromonadaceae bacterium W3.11]|nr:hypothetical protein [Porphyromonadaceae bacterium W3.11]
MNKNNQKRRSSVDSNPLHPFVTPEGYFEDFKVNIMERIKDEEQVEVTTNNKINHKTIWYYVAGIAAVIAVVLGVNFLSFEEQSQDLQANQVELLSEDEFEQFLIDESADDYWRIILLESEGDENMIGSSVEY